MSDAEAGTLSGRRVLVTGGSGFIGRRVVADLTEAGAQVRVIDLVSHPDPSVDLVQGDIADRETTRRAFEGGMDSVVHLAAKTSVLQSVQDPDLTYRTNVAGTHEVLEAAREADVSSLVFASTNAVTGPMDEPKITERARLRPLTPYGATKAAGEMLMSAYTAAYGVRCTAIRLTNVYGLGMHAKDSIVARLMRAILSDGEFEIYGDGTQVRDYVNSADVSRGVVMGLLNEEWSGPVIIGTGQSLSVLDVVEEVQRVTGHELRFGHGPAKPGEMPAVIVDNAKARDGGWEPQWTFSEGLAAVWTEWSEHGAAGPLGTATAATGGAG